MDLIAGNSTGISIFRAMRTTNQVINSEGGAGSAGSMSITDVDGDGNADVVSVRGCRTRQRRRNIPGHGSLFPFTGFIFGGYPTAVADFNGDGIQTWPLQRPNSARRADPRSTMAPSRLF